MARVTIPSGAKLNASDWEKEPLPAPPWNTFVSLVESCACKVCADELDRKLVRQIQQASNRLNLDDLEREMRKYPKMKFEDTMDRENQVNGLGEKSDGMVLKWLQDVPSGPHLDQTPHVDAAVAPHSMDALVVMPCQDDIGVHSLEEDGLPLLLINQTPFCGLGSVDGELCIVYI